MKFKPLILLVGTIGTFLVIILVGRTIEASGGDVERAIPRLLGYLLAFCLIALVAKRIFLRNH